ncbi:deoxyribodipyrimidine photo-lyase [Polynucleobacter ibericus]|uniref:deoxyribodipyrimidine photo-lyase n=1 Tax=Polynucleobacter ibericus TaxID=1819725 RepID=UPI00203B7343|nr:deoxyribodipyrimidine photo-lyase [Polynucleobacter ibericus]
MRIAIYWFRNDLRLSDNPAFLRACKEVDYLLPVYIHSPSIEEETAWGFPRVGKHRKVFLEESLHDLRNQLRSFGSNLFELSGNVLDVFEKIRAQSHANLIYCEQIEAPEELAQVSVLKDSGFEIFTEWQSSMLDPQALPFPLQEVPDIFTQFRQQV